MGNKNLRRLRCLVTAQTMGNLERLAAMDGCGDVGRMVDKLTREQIGQTAPEDGGYHRRPELPGLRL